MNRPPAIAVHIAIDVVMCLCLWIIRSPHVRNVRRLGMRDLAAAKPNAQALVNVLATPSGHLRVVAAKLLPPPLRHREESSGHHGHPSRRRGIVESVVEPLELGVPSEVAACHALSWSRPHVHHFLPGNDIQAGDGGDGDAFRVHVELVEQVFAPRRIGLHVAVEHGDAISLGSICARRSCIHESNRSVMSQEAHFLAHLGPRLCVRPSEVALWPERLKRRVAAVVDDDHLLEHILRREVDEALRGHDHEFVFAGAREHDAHRLD
mmetsp:Transcript_16026/g.40764  ORF Transcript_16026/g.40764 Transcript_16026/m.40764 type:complete len:265 (-) Transcript_16026:368-1162(-)